MKQLNLFFFCFFDVLLIIGEMELTTQVYRKLATTLTFKPMIHLNLEIEYFRACCVGLLHYCKKRCYATIIMQ
jgi:hypothetical protein